MISRLVRPARVSGGQHVEELAARLAAGQAVPPEEVLAVLDRCGIDEAGLQAAVDRHVRVRELRRQVGPAAGLEKKLATIQAKIDEADAAVQAARDRRSRLIAEVGEEHMTLTHRMEAIGHARQKLRAVENLPPALGEKLTAARAAANETSDAVSAAVAEADERRRRLRQAEEALPVAEAAAAREPNHADIQSGAVRARNAVTARREQLAVAEKAVAEARRVAASADASRAAVDREVEMFVTAD
jgi:chromosome segregation ATPase